MSQGRARWTVPMTALVTLGSLLPMGAARAQATSGSVSAVGIISTVAGTATTNPNKGFTGDGGPATSAELNNPYAIAFDSAGNLYIADTNNNVVRKVAAKTGIITTVAGDYAKGYGFSGDGGPATSAQLSGPAGIAVDKVGNLYIADSGNNVIRKVTTGTGIITTVAGSYTQNGGFSGDGGLATGAQLNYPSSVTLDSVGDLYIADTSNDRIRKITAATGIITTVAGNGALSFGSSTGGYGGDGGPATSAQLNEPSSVAIDHAGNLFIADSNNNVVREVTASTGAITTVAGSVQVDGYSGDGGLATNAGLSFPTAVALDRVGNLFIADYNHSVVREVMVDGIITTVAGDPALTAYNGDGEVATAAELYLPTYVALANDGSLYIADSNNLIRRVSTGAALPETAVGASSAVQQVPIVLNAATAVSGFTLAGNSVAEFTLGTATGCTLGGASNAAGTVCTVPVAFTPQLPGARTATLSVMNGSTVVGTVGLSGVGDAPLGTFASAGTLSTASSGNILNALSDPNGVAVDAAGNLYVGDSGNNKVVKITPAGVQTILEQGGPTFPYAVSVDAAGNVAYAGGVAGVGGAGGTYGSGGFVFFETPEGTQTTVGSVPGAPGGTAVDTQGNVYISDAVNNTVIEVVPGSGQFTLPTNGLSKPGALAVDAAGDVYIADTGNSRVVELTPAGVQTTLAATGLGQPTGVGVDAAGDVYILDHTNKTVIEVSPAGVQTTLPFTGLNNPNGLAVDGAGNVYVANSNGENILKLSAGSAALSFASTQTASSSPQQVVTLQNIGNQPLQIAALATTANFNLNGTGTTCMTSTLLEAGASCGLGVEFQPVAAGAITGTANVTDDSLNAQAPNNVQAVSLSGTGIAATQTTLTTSPSSVFAGTTVTLNATVTSTAGATPTGSVSFTSGNATLGTATLNASGVATVTTTALPVGTDSVTASYAGTPAFAASSSTNTLTVDAASFSFAASASATSLTVAQGASGTVAFSVAPQGAYVGSVAFSCTGLPSYATCTFSPSTLTLTASSASTTVNLTLKTNVQTARLESLPRPTPSGPVAPMAPAVAGGVLGLLMLKRKRLGRLVGLVILAGALAAGLGGCSGGSSPTASASATVTPTGTSTVNVVATGTAGGVVTMQTVPISITITQ